MNKTCNTLKRVIFLGLFAFFLSCSGQKVEAAGSFSISPANGNFAKSCIQSVDIVANVTSGQSNAADIIITYDVSKIEIIDAFPGVPGVQILPGNAYESYAGNIVNPLAGEIKLVGYSANTTLQSSATFASIQFKSKPLATNGAFSFTFVGANPYNTLDTNIADATTSYDMLTGVTNASYTFTNTSCASDTTPPTITFISPKNLANKVAPSSPVIVKVSDSGLGIALSSFAMMINGKTYTSLSPEVTVSGSPANYTITVTPSAPFSTNSVSVISVIVSDVAGNTSNGNISINSGFSCPITNITTPGRCPTVSLLPTPKPDRVSPTITVVSNNVIDLRRAFPIEISAKDNDGISPESFVLVIGNSTFTPAGTPDRIKIEGSKDNYTFSIDLKPEELVLTSEGNIVGSVKISDLEGNIRIEQLLFTTTGKPNTNTTTTSARTWQDFLAKALVYYVLPVIVALYLSLFAILSTQPTVVSIVDQHNKPIRFPRGYFAYANGSRQKLFGNVTGKLHGRIPHEAVTLVIQKYGFTTKSLPINPTIRHETKKVVLSQI